MTEQQVIRLMQSSKSADKWNANAAKVKMAHEGRYPEFWWRAIMESGLMVAVAKTWEQPATGKEIRKSTF